VNRARPLVAPAVGFLVGAAAGLWPLPAPGGLVVLLPLALAPRLAAAAFLAAGWLAAAAVRADVDPGASPPQGVVELGGRVVSVPEPVGDQLRFRLARAGGERVEVTAGRLEWPLALGDSVRLPATLRPPPQPLNPGARDRAGQLAAAGVPWLARAAGPVLRLAPPSPASALERLRGRFAEACERFLPPREASLLRAIGGGDRSALDDPARRSFARSGLAHILAVSGMHLVVVVFGLWKALQALLLRWDWLAARADPRTAAAALCLPWPFAYALATGANSPVLRAALAAALSLSGALLRREGDAMNGLALAALALLAGEPAAALDPSFQLSFAAVAGLALWAGPLRRRLPVPPAPAGSWRARLLEPLLLGGAATLAASLATAPVLAFHFRQLPLLGLPANLAAIPLGSGLTVLATAAALAAPLHPLCAAPFLLAARPLAVALRWISDLAAGPRWGALAVGTPGLAGALGCALLMVAAGRLRGARRLLAAAAAAGCLLLPAPLRAAAARHRGGLEVLFVAVGQGDAALLRLPDGAAVLVDGGGSPSGGPDPGEQVLVPLLRDLGVRRLAAVFVSHPHPDHVLGLRAVLEAFPVERAFGNGDPGEGEAAAVLARLAPAALRPGQAWTRAGVRFEALGGPREGLAGNDGSLVLRVEYGATRFLFTGDVEATGEAGALARGGLSADVVKVPHHGSRTSSSAALVAAVAPTHAVVSVGPGNRFGFPRPETVARWEAIGAKVERTDHGAIRFLSDGCRVRRVPTSSMLHPIETLRERP
jgi:competence protein ComEC